VKIYEGWVKFGGMEGRVSGTIKVNVGDVGEVVDFRTNGGWIWEK